MIFLLEAGYLATVK